MNRPSPAQQIKPRTSRRIIPYLKRYPVAVTVLLVVTCLDAGVTVTSPLMLKLIVDNGILPHRPGVVDQLATVLAGLAVLDALAVYLQVRCSAYIGQEVIYELRTQVFRNVQRQPLAFFARTQTGALVSRLNTDVIDAQQALMSLLSQTLSAAVTLVLVLAAIFYLSWQISLVSLALIPVFVLPGRMAGTRLKKLTRKQMGNLGELGAMTTERFNVAGAMLAKLYGLPEREEGLFQEQASRVRDNAVSIAVYGQVFLILTSLLTTLITALVYGLGGNLVMHGTIKIGTLIALVTLLTRLYAPITQLSSAQINVLTMLVSFDRLFEVLDLQPLVAERPGAYALPGGKSEPWAAPAIEFDQVWFRYPATAEVSIPSLESLSLPEHSSDSWTLRGLTFCAPAGQVTALVGPSGAGKTTISHLVPRLYDPTSGSVRIGGHDLRDLTLRSVNQVIGVVSQESHMFHDTIRGNLLYACPDATDSDMVQACHEARIWDAINSFPDGLDTVVGDRGYRLSGGEKQRLSIARLLLKAPPVIVLDEATAHLDSESEADVQEALRTTLAGRTSLVIAHRLSTIREADQILVIEAGRLAESGTHTELLASGGLYAKLYDTQFAHQAQQGGTAIPVRRRASRVISVPLNGFHGAAPSVPPAFVSQPVRSSVEEKNGLAGHQHPKAGLPAWTGPLQPEQAGAPNASAVNHNASRPGRHASSHRRMPERIQQLLKRPGGRHRPRPQRRVTSRS